MSQATTSGASSGEVTDPVQPDDLSPREDRLEPRQLFLAKGPVLSAPDDEDGLIAAASLAAATGTRTTRSRRERAHMLQVATRDSGVGKGPGYWAWIRAGSRAAGRRRNTSQHDPGREVAAEIEEASERAREEASGALEV